MQLEMFLKLLNSLLLASYALDFWQKWLLTCLLPRFGYFRILHVHCIGYIIKHMAGYMEGVLKSMPRFFSKVEYVQLW